MELGKVFLIPISLQTTGDWVLTVHRMEKDFMDSSFVYHHRMFTCPSSYSSSSSSFAIIGGEAVIGGGRWS